jgi:carbon catabolite-derepressing protein kinase
MDIQLYQVDQVNYLVDFKNVAYYKASTQPDSRPFEMAYQDPQYEEKRREEEKGKEPPICSPFLFLHVATKLIIELAGS